MVNSSAHTVERLNRTINHKLQDRLDALNQERCKWIEHINKIVSKYNNTIHSTIKMTPKEARDPKNELTVRWYIWSNAKRDRKYPDIKENDTVNIMIKKDSNTKWYMPKWSATTYVIDTTTTDPGDDTKLYVVETPDPQRKARSFLRHEILLV